ncbi:MAG: hypothetical protein RLZZ571_1057 [Actinomycetota bacterium]|jgi:hypothetical protein
MSADLTYEILLPAAPEKVFAILTSSDYLSEKVLHSIKGTFEKSGNSPEFRIQITRTIDGELPEMVRKFVGDELTVVEFQNWSEISRENFLAQFELKVNNAPVEIKGTISLSGTQSTQVSIKAKVKVNVPIFGAMAEPQVVLKLKSVLLDEENLCRQWIAK